MPHPRTCDRQHLRPYRQYQRPGPGEETCGFERAEQADAGARGMAGVVVADKGVDTGTVEGRLAARWGRRGGRQQQQRRRRHLRVGERGNGGPAIEE